MASKKQKFTEKILLHLLESLEFGCSYRFKRGLDPFGIFIKNWGYKDERIFKNGVRDLYRLKFINKNSGKNGYTIISLTEKGKLRALNAQLQNLKNKKEKWDGKWRMVAFDIPEQSKRGRDALRWKIKKAGFKEFQKSIFIFPYDCEKEIRLLVELFKLKNYVRFGILESIDNEKNLKELFKI